MMILNWVHRRLNGQASSVPLLPQKGHEMEMNNQEVETKERSLMKPSITRRSEEALLEWGDSLLAIGTLGFHALHHPHPDFIVSPRFRFQYSNSVFDPRDSVSDDYQEYTTTYMEEKLAGENDENPLVLNDYNHHEIEEAEDEMIALEPFKPEEVADLKEISTSSSVKSDRTTLADLFKAEEPDELLISKQCSGKWGSVLKYRTKEDTQMGKQKKSPTSFSTKLVQKLFARHEVRPIKKISHMMRKLMKGKIHPELPCQKSASKTENQGIMPLQYMDEIQANEGMSLLKSENGLVS